MAASDPKDSRPTSDPSGKTAEPATLDELLTLFRTMRPEDAAKKLEEMLKEREKTQETPPTRSPSDTVPPYSKQDVEISSKLPPIGKSQYRYKGVNFD